MGSWLKYDIEQKLTELPDVGEVFVELVFDPPWSPEHMSEAARLELGMG
jgi:metal-sulfur cluster biosynthetic enzyme